jgi:hypothetical protein
MDSILNTIYFKVKKTQQKRWYNKLYSKGCFTPSIENTPLGLSRFRHIAPNLLNSVIDLLNPSQEDNCVPLTPLQESRNFRKSILEIEFNKQHTEFVKQCKEDERQCKSAEQRIKLAERKSKLNTST